MLVKKLMFFLLFDVFRVAIVAKQPIRLSGSPEEQKVAAAIKKQNDEIKKQQEDVHKLLEKIVAAIELSCSGGLLSVTVCEHGNKTINCTNGRKIAIQDALYGRLDFKTCKPGAVFTTNCSAASSLPIVQSRCQGKASCVLHASNSLFGDPCFGTYKYLLVKYKCLE